MKQNELHCEAEVDWRCGGEASRPHRSSPLREEVEQDMVFELSVEDVWSSMRGPGGSTSPVNDGPQETHRARPTDMRKNQDRPEGTRHSGLDKLLELGSSSL